MKLPQHFKTRPTGYERQPSVARRSSGSGSVSPAGCCVEVCTPFGCRCLINLPICP